MQLYVISLEEVLWGILLVALTMAMHGAGMIATLRVSDALAAHTERSESFVAGVAVIILASWLIVITNILEIQIWATFFSVMGAQPNHSVAVYNAMLNYTTLQAGYLPQRWHLLEGLLGMAGLLTMAWSTGTLLELINKFQQQQQRIYKYKRERSSGP